MSYQTLLASISINEVIRLINEADAPDTFDLKGLKKELPTRFSDPADMQAAIIDQIGLDAYAKAFATGSANWKGLLDKPFLQTAFDAALNALPVQNDMIVKTKDVLETGNNWSGSYMTEQAEQVTLKTVTPETVDRLVALVGMVMACDLDKAVLSKTVKAAMKSLGDVHFGKFPSNHPKYGKGGKYGTIDYLEQKTEGAVKAMASEIKPLMIPLSLKLHKAVEGIGASDEFDKLIAPMRQWIAEKHAAELAAIDAAIEKAQPNATSNAFKSIAALVVKHSDDELDSRYRRINDKGVLSSFIAAIALDVPPERVGLILDRLKPQGAHP